MHIVVCIKQVPDSAQIRVHPVTNTIMRQGVPTIVNPYDLFALEAALRLRDQLGAKVTVLTMGPPMAEDTLRKALGFGADRAVLLTDRAFAGSDTLATSFALSQAILRIGQEWGTPDIVFTGKQTIDGDTAQVGPGIARRLGLNQVTYVSAITEVDPVAGTIALTRRAEGGVQELDHDAAGADNHAGSQQRGAPRQPAGSVARRPRQDRGVERRRGRHHRNDQMWPARLAHRGQARVRAAGAGRESRTHRHHRRAAAAPIWRKH